MHRLGDLLFVCYQLILQFSKGSDLFIFLFFLLGTLRSPAFGSNSEHIKSTLRPWAIKILTHYTLLKRLNLLSGPFFLAIDGPPGVGKSYLSQPLQQLIQEEAHKMGTDLNIQTFSQDSFLKSRATRTEEFAPLVGQEGITGYCAGDEYRWPELKSCLESVRQNHVHTASCYQRSDGELHDNVEFNYTSAQILIFEGCHSLGKTLAPLMHFSFFLTAPTELIEWNRAQRGLQGRKTWEQIHALNKVSRDHYTKYILPNQIKAQAVFRWQPDNTIPSLDELKTTPEATIERTLVQQKPSLHVGAIPAPQPAIQNSLLTALSKSHPAFKGITNESALTDLQNLNQQLNEQKLSPYQLQLLSPFIPALESEIELLQRGSKGSLITVILLWTARMKDQQEPLNLFFTVQDKLVELELNSLGEIKEVENFLSGDHSIIDNGVSWMGVSSLTTAGNGYNESSVIKQMRRLSLPDIHSISQPLEKTNDHIPSSTGGIIFPGRRVITK